MQVENHANVTVRDMESTACNDRGNDFIVEDSGVLGHGSILAVKSGSSSVSGRQNVQAWTVCAPGEQSTEFSYDS